MSAEQAMRHINSPKIQFPISPYLTNHRPSPFPTLQPFQSPYYMHKDCPNDLDFRLEEPEPTYPEGAKQGADIYRAMIDLIVGNVEQPEEQLKYECQTLLKPEEPVFLEAFVILVRKFKKLKKTKEEMTKYCMRKAFKHLGEKMRNEGHMQRGEAEFNLRYYCGEVSSEEWLTIPFRKNSIEKTMNTSFLKKIFSSQRFIRDYIEFAQQFRKLAEEDNEKKIVYLSQIVQESIRHNNLSKLESVKRLPWTESMLRRTEELALRLLQFRPVHLKELTDSFIQKFESAQYGQSKAMDSTKNEEKEEMSYRHQLSFESPCYNYCEY